MVCSDIPRTSSIFHAFMHPYCFCGVLPYWFWGQSWDVLCPVQSSKFNVKKRLENGFIFFLPSLEPFLGMASQKAGANLLVYERPCGIKPSHCSLGHPSPGFPVYSTADSVFTNEHSQDPETCLADDWFWRYNKQLLFSINKLENYLLINNNN